MTAFLPFLVEDYVESRQAGYLVLACARRVSAHPTFVAGRGRLLERHADRARGGENAQRYAGSNRDARHARGVQTLTTRAFVFSPPPDEEWVIVGYGRKAEKLGALRLDWQVNPSMPADSIPIRRPGRPGPGPRSRARHHPPDSGRLFAPHSRRREKAARKRSRGVLADLESGIPRHVRPAR